MVNKIIIINKMDKLFKKMDVYSKKSKAMGLSNQELDRYVQLITEYLQLKIKLEDVLFNDFILPPLLFDRASELYFELMKELDWKCEILVEGDRMDEIIEKFLDSEDPNTIIRNIIEFYKILVDNLNNDYADTEDKTTFEEVSLILSDGIDNSFPILLNHLNYKFKVLYELLEEGDFNEKIKEDCWPN